MDMRKILAKRQKNLSIINLNGKGMCLFELFGTRPVEDTE